MSRALFSFFLFFRFFRESKTLIPKKKWEELLHQLIPLLSSVVKRFAEDFSRVLTEFSRHLFSDVISVHNRNMKHARAIEFDCTNLLAML